MEIEVQKSEFLYSTPKLSLMRDIGREVVVVGRSNAGKSSLINAIGRNSNLARTSKTPGRTRHAVVYDFLLMAKKKKKPCILVDLPGFGFANMSKAEASQCEALIFSYLKSRASLQLIILLLDIRRSIDERERQIIEIANQRHIDLVLVLTKADKIVISKRKPAINKIAQQIDLNRDAIILHSIHDAATTEQLLEIIFNKM